MDRGGRASYGLGKEPVATDSWQFGPSQSNDAEQKPSRGGLLRTEGTAFSFQSPLQGGLVA